MAERNVETARPACGHLTWPAWCSTCHPKAEIAARCPSCGHAPHTDWCANLASDNECSCTTPTVHDTYAEHCREHVPGTPAHGGGRCALCDLTIERERGEEAHEQYQDTDPNAPYYDGPDVPDALDPALACHACSAYQSRSAIAAAGYVKPSSPPDECQCGHDHGVSETPCDRCYWCTNPTGSRAGGGDGR